MKRRDFINKTLSAGVMLAGLPVLDFFSVEKLPILPFDDIDKGVKEKMLNLISWMKDQGWQAYLKKELKINVLLHDLNALTKPLENIASITQKAGIEDFGGNKLIEPGSPSLSLLYHLLASPRVKSAQFKKYPEVSQLDDIENYIYAFVDIAAYPYQVKDKSNVFLAVLAYEYRPAFKAPPMDFWRRDGKEFAKMVYARTGIARTGTHAPNYDTENRSFTNLPAAEGATKSVAVMPARYGLFLVELVEVDSDALQIMNQQRNESTNLGSRYFINPIQKVCNTENVDVAFAEYHINEKLQKITYYQYEGVGFKFDGSLDFNKPPFIRISASNSLGEKLPLHATDEDMVHIDQAGSTILLSSVPNKLIREARQYRKPVSFTMPGVWKKKGNRRYSALKLPNEAGSDAANFVIADIIGRKRRVTTAFKAPKIAPLFANMKFEVKGEDEITHIDGESYQGKGFEEKINQGDYRALLFEDSICDGCVSAKITHKGGNKSDIFDREILPAFSLVTAPDFFPFSDSNDIRAYYQSLPNVNTDQDFLEGGSMNLSGIRQRGNPNLKDPFTHQQAFAENWDQDKSFDTITAVIGTGNRITEGKESDDFLFNFERKYRATSFLPDTGTGVFFPGWDATYSGDPKNPFFATFGLGSPFPEDMKLCAAANGMWPVTSPDAGRTFQGSLEPLYLGRKPNTAIPLMDKEIGLNKNSPYVKDYREKESYGWDGEQGPYLEMRAGEILINYTDINRADYLQNLRDENIGFDMSQLRELESSELIHRMDCQRKLIKEIDHKAVWKTKLWLAAAVKVDDWSKFQDFNCLPKSDLFGRVDVAHRQNPQLKGPGYMFVYILAAKNKDEPFGELDKQDQAQKRRVLGCEKIWICQVTRDELAYFTIDKGKLGEWESTTFK